MPTENPVPITVSADVQFWPQQSPINISEASKAAFPRNYLRFTYPEKLLGKFKKDPPPDDHGFNLVLNAGNGACLYLGGFRAELRKIHFHARSEHRLNGADFPVEVHLVHEIEDPSAGSTHIVLAVFLQKSRVKATPGTFLSLAQFLKSPPTQRHLSMLARGPDRLDTIEPPQDDIPINPKHFLPPKHRFYRYEGSLTTAPFTEAVSWILFRDPIKVIAADVKVIEQYSTHAARQPQPIARRFVLRNF